MHGRGPDSTPPWRGASSSARGDSRNGPHSWRGSSSSTPRDAPITRAGLRRVMGPVGRRLGEMEMLLSPSRGERAGLASLTEHATQDRFRAHVDDKLAALARDLPEGGDAAQEARRRAELSTILLDLRKLREGLTASHRVDGFTLKVYTDSIRYSLSAANLPQLSACLPHLVFDILPQLASALAPPPPSSAPDPLADSLATLSLTGQGAAVVDSNTTVLYQSLYLLYLICHLADLAGYHSALLAMSAPRPPPTPPSPLTPDAWDKPEPASEPDAQVTPLQPHLAYTQRVFAALAANNYAAFAKLVPPAGSPRPEAGCAPSGLHLAVARLAIPRLREQAWPAIAKSYKVLTDLEWLGRALLFAPGDVDGVRAFLKGKGVAFA